MEQVTWNVQETSIAVTCTYTYISSTLHNSTQRVLIIGKESIYMRVTLQMNNKQCVSVSVHIQMCTCIYMYM